MNEGSQQNLFSDIGYSQDCSHHPIHARTHTLEHHVHLPPLRKPRLERGQLAVSELRADLGHSGNHKVETRFLVQRLELLLHPALSGFYWVFVEVAPSRLDRFGGDAVNLSCCEQLQRMGHKSLA